MKKLVVALSATVALLAGASVASAQQDNTNVHVTATVGAACSFGGQGTMNLLFSIPGGTTGTVNQTGSGALNNVICTSSLPWTLTDDVNPAVVDGIAQGTATDGTSILTYHLAYSPTSGTGNAIVTVTGFINETETLPDQGYSGLPAGSYTGTTVLYLNF